MKKLFTLLVVALCALSVWAHDFQVDGIYYKTITSNEVEVSYRGNHATDYSNEYTGSVVIPETVTKYPGATYSVTSIGSGAFRECTGLTSITIPNSVKSIGGAAFEGCSSLTAITIPDSVTSIGYRAFYRTNVYYRESNWENGVLYISNCLIDARESISGAYVIKEGTRLIGEYAFAYCSGLTSITIPNSVTSIGDMAFFECSSLMSVTIPNSVTSIGNDTFAKCSALAFVTIPNSVMSIGYRAFYYCSALTSIIIPNTVKSIGFEAFNGCSGLISIESLAAIPPLIGDDVFYEVPSDIPVYVPCGSISTYQSAEGWNAFTNIHGLDCFSGQCGDNLYWNYNESSQTLSITGSGEMYDYTKSTQPWLLFQDQITEVTTSNTTTSIGTSAFEGCIRLGKVSVGYGVENIGANAFAECDRLYHIYCYPSYTPFAKQSSFSNYNVYLHVPCESYEMYNLDKVFGNFKYIECLGSDKVETDLDTVIVKPSTNDVTITWPTNSDADTYVIVIQQGDKVFCTLTFNKDGQLLNIAFAPGRDGQHRVQYAEMTVKGLRFTVTGLESGTNYDYTITAKDSSAQPISTYSGEFTTQSTTALENTQSPMVNSQKLLRNGQLIILRDGVEYNAQGQELR